MILGLITSIVFAASINLRHNIDKNPFENIKKPKKVCCQLLILIPNTRCIYKIP